MVKDQVHEEEFITDEDALLPRLEAKAPAQFQEEILQLVQQGIFQIRLVHDVSRFETQKLEHIGVADDEGG